MFAKDLDNFLKISISIVGLYSLKVLITTFEKK